MNRKSGFYWCDIGKCRGLLSGWVVCYYDSIENMWHLPYYNDKVSYDFFDGISDIPIIKSEEQFIGKVELQ